MVRFTAKRPVPPNDRGVGRGAVSVRALDQPVVDPGRAAAGVRRGRRGRPVEVLGDPPGQFDERRQLSGFVDLAHFAPVRTTATGDPASAVPDELDGSPFGEVCAVLPDDAVLLALAAEAAPSGVSVVHAGVDAAGQDGVGVGERAGVGVVHGHVPGVVCCGVSVGEDGQQRRDSRSNRRAAVGLKVSESRIAFGDGKAVRLDHALVEVEDVSVDRVALHRLGEGDRTDLHREVDDAVVLRVDLLRPRKGVGPIRVFGVPVQALDGVRQDGARTSVLVDGGLGDGHGSLLHGCVGLWERSHNAPQEYHTGQDGQACKSGWKQGIRPEVW